MLVGGPALAAFGATALLLAPQRAWAEEAEAVAIAMGEDQSFSLPTTLEEWVTYILFVTVVGLLSVVTGGVSTEQGHGTVWPCTHYSNGHRHALRGCLHSTHIAMHGHKHAEMQSACVFVKPCWKA